MRIDADHRVRLSLATGASPGLKRLQVGNEVAARIVIRHGAGDAVLEILGHRIRARFTRGVPAHDQIILRLEKSTTSSLLFKIITPREALTPRDTILPHLLSMKSPEFQLLRPLLARFVETGVPGIYLLNAHILRLDPKDSEKRTPLPLLKSLLSSGVSIESIRQIAAMHLLSTLPPSLALMLLSIFFGGKEKKLSGSAQGMDDESLQGIIEDIDAIADPEQRGDAVKGIIDLLSSLNIPSSPPLQGEFCICDDGAISQGRYIMNNDSIIITFELSQLGMVEILAREDSSGIRIHLYGDTTEHLKRLESRVSELKKSLQDLKKPGTIHLFVRSDIINKIVEIITQYALNSAIDITV
ncbi:MAG: hypothetical protein JXA20_16905 [Spirochaetes bacterium]|nr:hypothetical protein [Spirochaetota bacterium]